jgi:hypothetical protein
MKKNRGRLPRPRNETAPGEEGGWGGKISMTPEHCPVRIGWEGAQPSPSLPWFETIVEELWKTFHERREWGKKEGPSTDGPPVACVTKGTTGWNRRKGEKRWNIRVLRAGTQPRQPCLCVILYEYQRQLCRISSQIGTIFDCLA